MFRSTLLPVLAIASIGLAARAQDASATMPNFAPGQEWSVKAVSPTTAKIIIGHVERWGDKVSVNVSIVDIPIPGCDLGEGCTTTQIAHIPFEKSALAASVDRLLGTGMSPSPSFDSGYQQWRDAKGGIFTISVEKAIEMMFQTVNRGGG